MKYIQWNCNKKLTDVALKRYLAQGNYLHKSSSALVKSWFSGYHYFTNSFNGVRT